MPLLAGTGTKVHGANVRELVRSFKKTGKLGTSRPGSMKKALAQANAIAYRKARTVGHG